MPEHDVGNYLGDSLPYGRLGAWEMGGLMHLALRRVMCQLSGFTVGRN